jgi:hypothetical protein
MDTNEDILLEIDQSIINEATRCVHNHQCLTNNEFICRLAKVESFVGKEIMFVDCENNACKYITHFGYAHVCSCPVRIELHKKYQI